MFINVALEKGKDLAAALGAGGVLFSVYTASGLPVPATIAQVDQRIGAVHKQLDVLKAEGLEGQRAVIRLTRVTLRNEQSALERMMENLDTSARTTMSRRLGEIHDQLRELDANDAELRERIGKVRS